MLTNFNLAVIEILHKVNYKVSIGLSLQYFDRYLATWIEIMNKICTFLFITFLTLNYAKADNLSINNPRPPIIQAGSWVLMDYTTGKILAGQNEHVMRNPASLTKLMTGYVVEQAINQHLISLEDMVTVGRDAWAKDNPIFEGSSLMFLREGEHVSVRNLMRGVIIDSGNDACVALADYIFGGQKQFVNEMNRYANKLGMNDTHFETVHGLDAQGQHTSAYDLALISRAIISGKREFYDMYSEKSLEWNGIKQYNRNGLLWDNTLHIDGLKTGHTSGAGYNIIASSQQQGQRLIAVVMGGISPKSREVQAKKLLTWGHQNYSTVQALHSGKPIAHERIWFGKKNQIALGSDKNIWITIPKNELEYIRIKYAIDKGKIEAPAQKGLKIGEIKLLDRDKLIARSNLIELEEISEAGLFSRIWDKLKLML